MTSGAVEDVGPESFEQFGLLPEVLTSIEAIGFEKPTPIQSMTYAKVTSGKDVIAMAHTGTGKTAAFGIPMAQMLNPAEAGIKALVLEPTRELALQVSREIDLIGKDRGVRSAAVYGGASFTKQVSDVNEGAHIVVGTPGRVLDHIRRGTISFSGVKIVVLDEADEMLSMGFEKEISEIIESLPGKRQSLLFSATIPGDIQRLTKKYMGEAVVVSASGDDVAAKEVSHFVYLVSGQGRERDLVKILEVERPESAIVFCNTKEKTLTVSRYLKNRGYDADWLNSDLSQSDREEVMTRTRKGALKYLVATDVAARGIDISHISHVINFSFPESLEVYVHRTGRTGRMGKRGIAISLIAPHDIGNLYYLRLTYKIFPVEKPLPDGGDDLKKVELDRLYALRREFGGAVPDEFTGLARRLMCDVRGETIMGGVLAEYFSNAPAAESPAASTDDVESPEEKPAKPAAKSEEKKKSKPAAKSEEKKKGKPAAKKPARAAAKTTKTIKKADKDADGDVKTEIYVDAGRKDGLKISTLIQEIMDVSGTPRTGIGKVRLLARCAFVSVSEEHYKRVFKALNKIEIGDRKLKAEPAEKS